MKKVFPLIVLLITLSVLGIMFIQMSWIGNAIALNRDQFQKEVDNSLTESKKKILDKFAYRSGLYFANDESKQFYLENNFTSQVFVKDSLQQIIEKTLQQN